jgi:nucleoid DNA-binding protein
MKETKARMTKKDMVIFLADKHGLPRSLVRDAVQMLFNGIIDTLITEGRIELRNFGVFQVKRRKARKARNPRTGEPVEVAERSVVTFKPGQEMEDRIGELRLTVNKDKMA